MRPLALALALLIPAFAGCTTSEPAPDIVASIYPLGFVAERLAGDRLVVETFVPAGAEPHDWEPSSTEVARLAGSRLLILQGYGFEPWFEPVRAALGSDLPPFMFATTSMTLRPAGGEGSSSDGHDDHDDHDGDADADARVDPHTWLDPITLSAQSQRVESAMVNAFASHASAIRANGEKLRADLLALDQEFAAGLKTCDTRVIITNHDAYGYLGDRYAFEIIAISGLSPEAEPSFQARARASDAAREHNITIIFLEELASARVAEILADEVGATTRVLSPLEGLLPAQRAAGEDYFSLMRANLANLREAMRCT